MRQTRIQCKSRPGGIHLYDPYLPFVHMGTAGLVKGWYVDQDLLNKIKVTIWSTHIRVYLSEHQKFLLVPYAAVSMWDGPMRFTAAVCWSV